MNCKTCGNPLRTPHIMFGMRQMAQCINKECPESTYWRLSQVNEGGFPVDATEMDYRISEARKKFKGDKQ